MDILTWGRMCVFVQESIQRELVITLGFTNLLTHVHGHEWRIERYI